MAGGTAGGRLAVPEPPPHVLLGDGIAWVSAQIQELTREVVNLRNELAALRVARPDSPRPQSEVRG